MHLAPASACNGCTSLGALSAVSAAGRSGCTALGLAGKQGSGRPARRSACLIRSETMSGWQARWCPRPPAGPARCVPSARTGRSGGLAGRRTERAHASGPVCWPTHDDELARGGRLAAAIDRYRSQVQRLGGRLCAHRDLPGAARPDSSGGRVMAQNAARRSLISSLVYLSAWRSTGG